MTLNRQFKDSLFRALFGREENKENLLSLYNALNHTTHTDVNDLTLNTIDDVIYMSVKNDISCLIDDRMSLYEHQSSINPNMPVRGLIYFGKLYEKYFDSRHLNRFSRHLVKLPAPKYYIFYNGREKYPDRTILRLTDAFENTLSEDEAPCLECTAVMLNINAGHNKKLMQDCRILFEYSIFVEKCRQYAIIQDKETAVKTAVRECISEDILKDFLTEHETEVVNMFLTDYNEAETMEMFKKEYYEDGLQIGYKQGEKAGFDQGQAVGFGQGQAVGFENARKEIILKMLSAGQPIKLITQLTGASEGELERLSSQSDPD